MIDHDFFDNISVYEGIKQGLEEAIAFKQGDTTKAHVRILSTNDASASPSSPINISQLREDLCLSPQGLAHVIGVSPRTVIAWETGKSTPNGVASRMLYLIENDHSIVDKLMYR
jgi:putative transcriptional regulator